MSTHSAHAFLRGQKNLVQNILHSSLGVYKVIFIVFAISFIFFVVFSLQHIRIILQAVREFNVR